MTVLRRPVAERGAKLLAFAARCRTRAAPLLLGLVLVLLAGTSRAQFDQDADGIVDPLDNCPRVVNPDQANADAARAGDACRCSDVDRSYTVDLVDVVRVERFARGEAVNGAFELARCDIGAARSCAGDDALGLRFYLAGIVEDLTSACAAADLEFDADANDDGVVDVLDGSIVGFCVGKDPGVVCACRRADVDRDADVDLDDLQCVSALFNQSGFPIAPPRTGTPDVVSVTPGDGSALRASPVELSIRLAAPADPLIAAGLPAALVEPETLTSRVELPLVEGANTVDIVATGADCSAASAQIELLLDQIAPVVQITSPGDAQDFVASAIDVSGTVDDPAATVDVNGVPAAVSGNSWVAAGVSLQVGSNLLVASARGRADNAAAPDQVGVTRVVVLESIELSPRGRRLSSQGAQQAYTVTARFSNGTTADVSAPAAGTTYASSSDFVAAIDANGLATAADSGVTTIRAQSAGLEASASLTVELGVALESISVAPRRTTLFGLASSQPLQLTGHFDDGTTRDLTAATTGTTYISSAPDVASVTPDGRVEARATFQTPTP